ncbi:MAG TPA: STAS domain-containing protein [Caulifigura sp.]|jgi:anti-anti-sigma factor|nr:STAS domain-containing protein [Caulifigura sp.]
MVTHSRQGAVDVLSLDAALQEENCDGLRTAAEECVKRGQPRLIIDLGSVAFIDSAGLEVLLDINDRCLERGGACKLSTPNALCIDILNATGVGQELEIVDSIVKGAGSFAL